MSNTICLIGGPADGSLIAVPELALIYTVAIKSDLSPMRWTDLADRTLDSVVPRYGRYERGRKGRDVTFYQWVGVY